MLRPLNLICLFLLLLLGCSKSSQKERKLKGDWKIISYKRTTNEGLSFYSNVSGSLNITCDKNKDPKTLQFNLSYVFPTDSSTIHTTCNFNFTNKKADYLNLYGPSSWMNLADTVTARILVSTHTNLELEIPDKSGQVHTFISVKN